MDDIRKKTQGIEMDLLKKHTDTVVILTGILASVMWMNHKFDQVEKDILVIKTVLVMQKIMPTELAHGETASKS